MRLIYTDDDEHAMLRQSAREFLAAAITPAILRSIADAGQPMPADIWPRVCGLGWVSLLLDGGGAGLAAAPALAILAEEAGRALFPGPLLETSIAAAILAAGPRAEPARIEAIVSGSTRVAWCLAADVAGWSPALGRGMSLRRVGQGYELSGRAAFVHDADQADVLLVSAAGPDGLATAWVDPAAPQVRVTTQRTLDVTRRFNTVEISSLNLADGAVIPGAAESLGPLTLLNLARLLIAADCLGGCAAVLDAAVRYSRERVTFGRVIGSYQAIKHKLADMLVALETARVSVQHAASSVAGQPPEAAARAVSIAKAHACESYSYLASESLQIHGGIGFAWDHDCHLYIRRARTSEVLYGTPSWHYRQLAEAAL